MLIQKVRSVLQQIRGFHAIQEIEHLLFLFFLPFFINPWGDEPFFIPREWLLSFFLISFSLFKKLFIEIKRFHIFLFLLVFLPFISAISSDSKLYSLTRSLAIFNYALYLLFLLNIFKGKDNHISIAFIFSITSLINALLAVFQFYGIDPFFSLLPFFETPERVLPSRAGGFLGGPIPLISFLSTTAPVALSLSLSGTKKFLKFIGFLSYLLSLYVSTLAGKRIGMIAILITSLFLIIGYIKSLNIRPKLLFLIGTIFLSGVLISCMKKHPLILNQLRYTELYKGIRERVNLWYYTAKIIFKNPLFGAGPGRFKIEFFDIMVEEEEKEGFISKYAIPKMEGVLYYQPHNIFLEIASDTGVLCLFLSLFLLIEVFIKGVKIIKRGDILLTGFFLSVISFLIFSFFQPSLNFPVSLLYAITSAGVLFSFEDKMERSRFIPKWLLFIITIPFFLYTSAHIIGDSQKRYGKMYLLEALKTAHPEVQSLLINASEKRLKKALRYAPYDGEGRYWLGYLYCITGRAEICINELERAKRFFRSAELYFNLGSAYETTGDIENALINFSIAYSYNRLPQALERISRHKMEYLELIKKCENEGMLKEVKILKRIYGSFLSK